MVNIPTCDCVSFPYEVGSLKYNPAYLSFSSSLYVILPSLFLRSLPVCSLHFINTVYGQISSQLHPYKRTRRYARESHLSPVSSSSGARQSVPDQQLACRARSLIAQLQPSQACSAAVCVRQVGPLCTGTNQVHSSGTVRPVGRAP